MLFNAFYGPKVSLIKKAREEMRNEAVLLNKGYDAPTDCLDLLGLT